MQLLVIFSTIFAFALFVAIFSNIGMRIDNKNKRLQEITGKKADDIDEDLNIPFTQRFFLPVFYKVIRLFSKIFPKNKKNEYSDLENNLKLANIKMSASEFLAARLIVGFLFIAMAFAAAYFINAHPLVKFLFILAGLVFAIYIPSKYITARIKARQKEIKNQLPDVLDLLTVSVEAGLGFDAAIIKIGEYFQGTLIDELLSVQREIQMSIPRRDALKKFANRNDIDELKTFVGALIQAEHLGLPIKNVLRIQSRHLRNTRKQAAEEKAMKAPVKMILPLVAFVFPVIFIILLGPTVIQIINTFG